MKRPVETLRRAASDMREYAARGIAWEEPWDGDRAADKGWLAPEVALAVADWLEGVAADAWAGLAPISEHDMERTPEQRNALAVADAYLEGGTR